MKSELVGQEKNRVEIRVDFEAAEFSAELDRVFNNISQRASIPGFRKGHVPRKTIEMRFGRNDINDEVIENLLNKNVQELLSDYDIEPLFAPQVKSKGAVLDGQPVSINLLIEARPEINLPELGEIEVERLISVVDEPMINDLVEKFRNSHANFQAIDSPDARVNDDSVLTVEFEMALLGADGTEKTRGKKREMATIDMRALPGEAFREPLTGKTVGDSVDVTLRPEEMPEADPNYTSTRYDMKIIEIGEKILPELTPEFFRECTGVDCPTEEAFRAEIANNLLEVFQDSANADAEVRALAAVADKTELDVPGSLVYQEMQRLKALDAERSKERFKMDFEEFLKLRGANYADYEKQVTMQAWAAVRDSLIVDELARKFEIKLEPSDLDAWISYTAKREALDEDALKKTYYKDKDSVNVLVDRVMAARAKKLLLEKVKLSDVSELTPPPEPQKPEEGQEQTQPQEQAQEPASSAPAQEPPAPAPAPEGNSDGQQ